jgi:hypothetical protein
VLSTRLIRLYRGVHAIGHVEKAREVAWLAAVKACGPGAALSHLDSGELWKFLEPDEGHLPHVTAPGNRSVPGIRVDRSALDARDVMHRRGIRVTSPARTLIDLASTLSEQALRHAVRQAQGGRLLSVPYMLRTLDRLGPRRGTHTLRRSSPRAQPQPAASSGTLSSTSSYMPASSTRTPPSRSSSTAGGSCPTSAGRRTASSLRPTAPGTTASSTRSARRCSRPTASGWLRVTWEQAQCAVTRPSPL